DRILQAHRRWRMTIAYSQPVRATDDVDLGRRRVVLEALSPEIDAGRFPAKRVIGEQVRVEIDAYVDGHDAVACVLRYRKDTDDAWREVRMQPLVNDRWYASFTAAELGVYRYTVEGWVDTFETWRRDLAKRIDANQDIR